MREVEKMSYEERLKQIEKRLTQIDIILISMVCVILAFSKRLAFFILR